MKNFSRKKDTDVQVVEEQPLFSLPFYCDNSENTRCDCDSFADCKSNFTVEEGDLIWLGMPEGFSPQIVAEEQPVPGNNLDDGASAQALPSEDYGPLTGKFAFTD